MYLTQSQPRSSREHVSDLSLLGVPRSNWRRIVILLISGHFLQLFLNGLPYSPAECTGICHGDIWADWWVGLKHCTHERNCQCFLPAPLHYCNYIVIFREICWWLLCAPLPTQIKTMWDSPLYNEKTGFVDLTCQLKRQIRQTLWDKNPRYLLWD